ncbi:MAG: TIGR03620 family F420-dependent LLM class oxidoreductase [Acidimicrobiia bacterium]|nr:TIGR03620 family F420-dependent LLM class oxidoreductase [Acidimicrobiia bacterium]
MGLVLGTSVPPLGRVGAWSGRLQRRPTTEAVEVLAELDQLGYRSVWIPESPFGKDVLTFASVLLGSSSGAAPNITVATGIAITWVRDPVAMMNAARTIGDAHPERFLLGIGISHDSTARARGHVYRRPVAAMADYLETMAAAGFDGHGPAWQPPVVIAALGPRMLDVAARLADGAHPFVAPPEHTAVARAALGPDKLLAVEQGVVLADGERARQRARTNLERFLAWPNYRRHFLRLGFDEVDLAQGGSDRLVDAVFAIGGEEAVDRRVRAHLDAGADHVCLQIVTDDPDDELAAYRRLAAALTLA